MSAFSSAMNPPARWRSVAVVVAANLIAAKFGLAHSAPARGSPFADDWIDAAHGPEPELQVQRYDDDTFVLRQSIKTNVEGPFLYLFFGTRRVLEIDTGAGGAKIRPNIDAIIAQRLRTKNLSSLQLVVAHSHSHDDHVAGDEEFIGRPDTTVVGHSPEAVAAFFGIRSWPDDVAAFDLGGRELDIIPSPGHEPAEIAVFDRRTRLLLTGDELYPGRLYIPSGQFETYRHSIDRVVAFTRGQGVSWVLGCHIEMTRHSGRDYPLHAPSHPLEHRLELRYASLLALQSALHSMGNEPQLEVHSDFIIYPLP